MVDQQDARVGLQVDQSVAAINSAEDQATGRVMRRLQANEDLDIGAVNAAKEQAETVLEDTISRNPQLASDTPLDAAANSVARSLPDGAPIDQAETGARSVSTAAEFLSSERQSIASQLADEGLPVTPSRVERELGQRLGREAYTYGPEYTQVKQALQLGATYDPALFKDMAKSSVRIAGTDFPTGRVPGVEESVTPYTRTPVFENVELGLRQPVYMKETAERLQERVNQQKDFLGQVRLEVSPQINQLQKQQAVLGEQQNMLLASLNRKPDQELGQQLQSVSKQLKDNDRQLAYLNNRLEGATQKVRENIDQIELPTALKPGVEEGQRIAYAVNPQTGEPLAGTAEIVSERKVRDMDSKGGGGRNIAEFSSGSRQDEEVRQVRSGGRRVRMRDYDPESLSGQPAQRFETDRSQTGSVTDIYGVRPAAEAPADPEVRPGKPGRSRMPLTQKPTEAGRRSIDASEEIRRIRATNPPDKAQDLVNTFLGALKDN